MNLEELIKNVNGHNEVAHSSCIQCGEAISSENVFTKNGWKEVGITGLCEVCFDHSCYVLDEDIDRITENKNVKRLLEIQGCILAGGSLRVLVDPTDEIKDYDLFFLSEEALWSTLSLIESMGGKKVFECPEGLLRTYRIDGVKYQLISKEFYGTLESVIEDFDITACCAAFDGKEIVYHRRFISDNLNKQVHLNKITYPVATMKRIAKYAEKGFYLTNYAVMDFIKYCAENELDENNLKFYID